MSTEEVAPKGDLSLHQSVTGEQGRKSRVTTDMQQEMAHEVANIYQWGLSGVEAAWTGMRNCGHTRNGELIKSKSGLDKEHSRYVDMETVMRSLNKEISFAIQV